MGRAGCGGSEKEGQESKGTRKGKETQVIGRITKRMILPSPPIDLLRLMKTLWPSPSLTPGAATRLANSPKKALQQAACLISFA
jgi:hypothetical protein